MVAADLVLAGLLTVPGAPAALGHASDTVLRKPLQDAPGCRTLRRPRLGGSGFGYHVADPSTPDHEEPPMPAVRPLGSSRDAGGAMSGVIVAVLILAAVAVGAFFYFGGEADVDVEEPEITITSDETPGS